MLDGDRHFTAFNSRPRRLASPHGSTERLLIGVTAERPSGAECGLLLLHANLDNTPLEKVRASRGWAA